MEQLSITETATRLPEAVKNREIEIQNMESDIKRIDGELVTLKPIVLDYNAKLKCRKDLRRQLAKRQFIFHEIVSFLGGTNSGVELPTSIVGSGTPSEQAVKETWEVKPDGQLSEDNKPKITINLEE